MNVFNRPVATHHTPCLHIKASRKSVQSQRWSNEGDNYQTGRCEIIYLLQITPLRVWPPDLYNNGGQQEEIACVRWVQTGGH